MKGPFFIDDAFEEYQDAVVYHEHQQEGLGARLVQVFDEAIALAMEFSAAAPAARFVSTQYDARSRLLHPFKINLVYTVRHDELIVVAVFHASRRPGYWVERLRRLR